MQCTGCTANGEYENATITNVTFGDVYHCSGQSNVRQLTSLVSISHCRVCALLVCQAGRESEQLVSLVSLASSELRALSG